MTHTLKRKITTLLILPTFCICSVAFADTTDAVKTHVLQWVQDSFRQLTATGDIQVELADMDPRFRIAACDDSLTLALTQELTEETLPGRHSVSVHCESPTPWTIYLPVTINVWREIPVLVATLKRGDTIRTQDVMMRRQNLATLYNRHCFSDAAQVIGKMATRNLAAGTALYTELLAEPDMVKKGDQVALIVKSGSITVSSTGRAQQSGKQGDSISVENLTSNRTLTGRIIDKNTVSLSL